MIRRLFRKFIQWSMREGEESIKIASDRGRYGTVTAVSDDELGSRPLRFSIYNANGGRVVETSYYDPVKDHNRRQLYVLTSDDDLGKSLEKIITMEYLKS